MRLWIGNINPDTSEEDLREFLKKYCGVDCGDVLREDGDGTRPAAVVDFPGVGHEVMLEYQRRLHQMFWRDRTINVQVAPDQS